MKLLKNSGALPSHNLDNLILVSQAAQNLDLALRDTKMLGQQLDYCTIGLALLWGLLDFHHKAAPHLADLLSF